MRKINFGIIQFPGSNCEQDCFHVLSYVLKQNCRYIWHDTKTLKNIDCVIVPGGFSYGDYLSCLLYTSPSPRDRQKCRMPSSA